MAESEELGSTRDKTQRQWLSAEAALRAVVDPNRAVGQAMNAPKRTSKHFVYLYLPHHLFSIMLSSWVYSGREVSLSAPSVYSFPYQVLG